MHISGFKYVFLETHWISIGRVDDIGKSIVAAAKEIVIKQRTSSKSCPEENDKKSGSGFQLRVDSRLQSLEDKIDGLEDKIDRILSAMTRVGKL